jgi:hypothetical protein
VETRVCKCGCATAGHSGLLFVPFAGLLTPAQDLCINFHLLCSPSSLPSEDLLLSLLNREPESRP